jgi:CubicO group peptidase (beta-lactamase class C family)
MLLATACERSAAAAAVQQGGPLDAVIDSLVEAEALARGVPAIGIAVVAEGRIVLQRTWGRADVTSGRAATAATPFNIASVTKPFTSALLVQLAGEGKLGLDDRVRRHLPELPERYREITVRQLLTHTSGIARDLRLDNFDDPDADTYRARLDTASASASPGERFQYSNTGYTVLGWMIESIEGQPLDDVLRRRIFEPAGMLQARYRVPLATDPLRARPHAVVDGSAVPIDYITGGFASGGMSMSTADAAAFAVALQGGSLLTGPFASAVWMPAELATGEPVSLRMFDDDAGYGFGWFITRYAGLPMMTHGGGIEGYSANLYHFPTSQLTIIVLSNAKARDDGTAPVDPLARRIADVCLAGNHCRLDAQTARVRAEIHAANGAFSTAYLAGDTIAIRAMYAPDVLALPPNARAVAGASSVARLFRPGRSNRRVDHALYTERLVQYDSTLTELGTWYDGWVDNATGTPGAATGRYTLTWVRRSGGWRIATDSWVGAPPD